MSARTEVTGHSINIDLVDEMIYNIDVYNLQEGEFAQIREEVANNYVSTLIGCDDRFAEYQGSCKEGEVAYIPTTAFKRAPLITSPESSIAKWCLSSGTLGARSSIGRDQTSLDRLLGSVRKSMGLFEDWDEEEIYVLHLGPRCEDAGDVWFPYVMGLTELLYPTDSFATVDKLDIPGAVARYLELRAGARKVGLIGAPFAVKLFCEAYAAGGWPAEARDQIAVITAGGWKTHIGESIPRDVFRRQVAETLGASDETRVRDAFNQVELNTVMMECEHHALHIPPWVSATALCPRTLRRITNGSRGLLAYIDASAASYPCIIVGDDFGVVCDAPCSCGRPGNQLKIDRRVQRGENAGCALALSERFGSPR